MKNRKIVCAAALLLLAFSAEAKKTPSLTQYGSAAVISIYGNQNLSEQYDVATMTQDEEDSDTSMLSALIDKAFYKDDPEPLTGQDRVDYAEDYMRYALENIAEMKVASPDSVIGSESYSSIVKNPFLVMDYEISATGFTKNITSVGAKKARTMMKELGVNSLVIAEFKFNKVFNRQSKLKCDVRPQVIMDVQLYDAKGSQVVYWTFTANTTDSLPVRKFKYDQDALIEMYPALIENAINQFVMKYL